MNLSLSISPKDRAFSSWLSMMRRCFISSEASFPDYGERGITVCERWYDWRNFLADMGGRPHGMTLDRINVSGNYEPGNCRWADRTTQNRNTRKSVLVDVGGAQMLACDAAALLGVTPSCISRRIRGGGPIAERRPLKLTVSQVAEIKRRLACGDSVTRIAKDSGVSRQHIGKIRDGECWSNVKASK
jgi:hypothetical protein